MKGTFFISLVVVFSMLAIPLSALQKGDVGATAVSKPQNNVTYQKTKNYQGPQKIRVLKNNEILEFSTKDYIFGVVAAEMPALYEVEALKAQAVAAYTFVCYQIQNNTNKEYDISADPQTAQGFITREEAATRWGEKAEEYSKKIDDCINSVSGQVLVFSGNPIFAAYHAISSGSTNSCADVWGKDIDYLKSVSSVGDCFANGYQSQTLFAKDDLCQKLQTVSTAIGEPQNFFTDISTTDNGYVKTVTYCGKQMSGAQLCNLLGLRSANFEISVTDNNFTFNVKGYGHGVGMSQTGADYMAKQGSTYQEILLHYYDGATLEKN